jgi:hypothetical protein
LVRSGKCDDFFRSFLFYVIGLLRFIRLIPACSPLRSIVVGKGTIGSNFVDVSFAASFFLLLLLFLSE